MDKYVIKNRNTNCFISDTEFGTFYKVDVSMATRFSLAKALNRLNKLKHPENWDLVKVEEK